MLKNQDIICISSIDWDFIWQGHQEIMSALAKNGNRVLFVENTGVRAPGIRDLNRIRKRFKNWLKGIKGIRQEQENLYVFSPIVLPFPYLTIARWINRFQILSVLDKWMRSANFNNPIIWTFLPTPLSLDVLDSIFKKLVVYYCIDSFSVSSSAARKIGKYEMRLLKKSDLVFTTSKALHEHCAEINKKVSRFPFGVNFEKFNSERLGDNGIPEDLKAVRGNIIGYVGGVHKWIDQELVRAAAEQCPEYSFVFVGPVQTDICGLRGLKNVHFLGSRPHDKLPLYIKYFDACIIPYRISEYTKNVYPTKMNEYLAMGKPVISTSLPEVKDFNGAYGDIVSIGEDNGGFCRSIKDAMARDSAESRQRRIEIARQNSWESRIEGMASLMEDEINRKQAEKDAYWKENLKSLYRTARRRMLKLVAVCLLLYVIVFKTSLPWFFADPLKIAQPPQKADAIVVFGGGVGETGSPGTSTIERARYAAKLYNQGYADKIIFSSGYYYIYNDAQNMRLIALSMGVADRDIILEERANSTYENVIFSKKLLDKEGLGSILLISSPYNMRRAYFVFKRHARGLEVTYTPPDVCQFYDSRYPLRSKQLKAIMHEYLGIIYYLFKGYV